MPKVTIPCQTKFHILTCPAVYHINGQSKSKSIQQEKSFSYYSFCNQDLCIDLHATYFSSA